MGISEVERGANLKATSQQSLREAIKQLRAATDRDEFFAALLKQTESWLSTATIYLVRHQEAHRRLIRRGSVIERATEPFQTISLAKPSVASQSLQKGVLFLGKLTKTDPWFAAIAGDSAVHDRVCLLPIVVANRTVAILAGDVDIDEISSLSPVLSRLGKETAKALSKLILRLKDPALQAIHLAQTPDELLLAVLSYASRWLDFPQIYTVKRHEIQGRYALHKGTLDTNNVKVRRLSLSAISIMTQAIRDGMPYLGPLPEGDPCGNLCSHTQQLESGIVLVPIGVKEKTICVLVGHPLKGFNDKLRNALTALEREAASALAELIVEEKHRRGEHLPTLEMAPAKLPNLYARRWRLVEVLLILALFASALMYGYWHYPNTVRVFYENVLSGVGDLFSGMADLLGHKPSE